jgi:hypothetical protein
MMAVVELGFKNWVCKINFITSIKGLKLENKIK